MSCAFGISWAERLRTGSDVILDTVLHVEFGGSYGIFAATTPLTVTCLFPGDGWFVVPSPSTVRMLGDVSVTAPVLVTTSVVPTVVAPKVVAEPVPVVPVVVVVNLVPTVPDTFNGPTDVSAEAPVLSRTAVRGARGAASSSVMTLPVAVTVPPKLFAFASVML